MKRSEMSDAEFGQHLQRTYDAAMRGFDGDEADSPRAHVNSWMQMANDDVPPGGGEIDDEAIRGDPSSPVSPAAANRSHGKTAIDSNQIALDELAIRQSGVSDPESLIRLARLRRTHDSAGVSTMARIIPGYTRLG